MSRGRAGPWKAARRMRTNEVLKQLMRAVMGAAILSSCGRPSSAPNLRPRATANGGARESDWRSICATACGYASVLASACGDVPSKTSIERVRVRRQKGAPALAMPTAHACACPAQDSPQLTGVGTHLDLDVQKTCSTTDFG